MGDSPAGRTETDEEPLPVLGVKDDGVPARRLAEHAEVDENIIQSDHWESRGPLGPLLLSDWPLVGVG